MAASLGVFNQVHWPGVGDVDECWIVATYWALVAAGILTREQLPSIRAFRAAAGVPDRPGPTGGGYADIMRALKKLVPNSGAVLYTGTATGFIKYLQRGYVASLFVLSKNLPKYLQFGFTGTRSRVVIRDGKKYVVTEKVYTGHQVSVFMRGDKIYIMNPLAPEGSALLPITLAQLKRAAGTTFRGILFPLGGAAIKAIIKKAKKLPPGPPRDLMPPLIEIDFYRSEDTIGFYRARHNEDDQMGNLPAIDFL